MRWMVSLEVEYDPIILYRLLNVLRRKDVTIDSIMLTSSPSGILFLAFVNSPEKDVEHIFNFVRRMPGVRGATRLRLDFPVPNPSPSDFNYLELAR